MSQKFKSLRNDTTTSGIWLALQIAGYAVFFIGETILEYIANNGANILNFVAKGTKQFKSILPDEIVNWADKYSKNNTDKKNAKKEADKLLKNNDATWCEKNDRVCKNSPENRNCIDCDQIDEIVDSLKNAACYNNININRSINIENININIINNKSQEINAMKDSDEILGYINSNLDKLDDEAVTKLLLIIKDKLESVNSVKK